MRKNGKIDKKKSKMDVDSDDDDIIFIGRPIILLI